VLGWLNNQIINLKTYVSNEVTLILDLSGPQALLAEVRRTYLPTRGRAIAHSVVG